MNDTMFKILLTMWMKENYEARCLDVKTAFLHGELKEEIFIKEPDGYREFAQEELGQTTEDTKGKFIKLEKTLYGLVQAAREWWKTFIQVLKTKLNFEQFQNDICLLKRVDERGFCAMGIYVDDCILIGDKEAINNAIRDIKEFFKITTEEINKFIGCKIKKHEDKILLHQPDLIKKLLKKFGEDIAHLKNYDMPASALFKIIRPKEGQPKLSQENQKKYRSGVGSLLYLVKHSRPDLSNAVQELTKAMDGATEGHMKALYRAIKFVENTKNYKLIMNKWDTTDLH